MPRLHDEVAHRRAVARAYRERLADVPEIAIPWSDEEVERAAHFGFPIVLETHEDRDRLVAELERRRIQTTSYPAITTLSAYSDHPARPRSEDLARRHVLLPLSSTFPQGDLDIVVAHLREALEGATRA
jgi:dTDP-4-amino-4,6-dideoxygalactose transaminase